MERICIPINKVYEELRKRGCVLHHANAVETSLTFFHRDALLSRGRVLDLALPQTSQWSDPGDAQHGILNDVFLNFADFHKTFSSPNKYGPILFVLDLERLFGHLSREGATISVTNKAPHLWNSSDQLTDRWLDLEGFKSRFEFSDSDPVRAGWVKLWPDMVIGRLQEGIPIECVTEVKIDSVPNDPNFFFHLLSKVQELNPAAGALCKRRAISDCTAKCTCGNAEAYAAMRLQGKLDSGSWGQLPTQAPKKVQGE